MSQLPPLPPVALKRLEDISREKGVPMAQLQKELYDKFNTKYVQGYQNIPTVEGKLDLCSKLLKGQYQTLYKTEPIDTIFMGLGRVGPTNSGAIRGEGIVIPIIPNQAPTLRSLVAEGRDAATLNNLQTMCRYNQVQLQKFSSGDFKMDFRAKFENPQRLGMTTMQMLDKVGIKRCTIAQSVDNLAKVEKNFPVATDWRIIRGFITDMRKGQKKKDDGSMSEWAVYNIYDESLESEYFTPDGSRSVKPNFSVWVNPALMTLDRGNECDFCGPISQGKDKDGKTTPEVSMTGYLIDPVNAIFGAIQK